MTLRLFRTARALSVGALILAAPAAGQYYVLTDLGLMGGKDSHAQGINNNGAVVGYYVNAQGNKRAFLWTAEDGAVDIGHLGGGLASASAVNDHGAVVGWSTREDGFAHAFLWKAESGMTDLGDLGSSISHASDINNDDVVVGDASVGQGQNRAFRWTAQGGIESLGTLGKTSEAKGINDQGVIVGSSVPNQGVDAKAFLWTVQAGMKQMAQSGRMAGGLEVSEPGTVVGNSAGSVDPDHAAYYWTMANGEVKLFTDNKYDPQASSLFAVVGSSVNSAGLIVGTGDDNNSPAAFVWEPRYRTIDLNSVLPADSGWRLTAALDINDSGQIVGTGVGADGKPHAFLLTPRQTQPVIYVKAGPGRTGDGLSWATAYSALDDALLVSALGGGVVQVWVAEGRYVPVMAYRLGNPRYGVFRLDEDFSLYGGFAGIETDLSQRDWQSHPTILDGDVNGDDQPGFVNYKDNVHSVVRATAFADNKVATLDGFVVRGGNADVANTIRWYGGGVCSYGGHLIIANCRFEANMADHAGGVWAVGTNWLRDCAFDGNAGYSDGAAHFENTGVVEDCLFINNHAINDGAAALYSLGSGGLVARCTFVGNVGGQYGGGAGLEVAGGSQNPMTVVNCRMIGNTSEDGSGGAYFESNVEVTNCLALANSGFTGGGFSAQGQQTFPRLTNCTIAFNSASYGRGGGLWHGSGTTILTNCVLWGNLAGDPDEGSQIGGNFGEVVVNYCAVQYWSGGLGGIGNSGEHPLFADPIGPDGVEGTGDEDLSLTAGSPYLDAGDNTAVPGDAADLDNDGDTAEPLPIDLTGHARFVEVPGVPPKGNGVPPYVDLGPFEFDPSGCRPDFDGDGTLSLFDFLAFVNLFNAHDAKADIDGNGAWDLFDFLGFVNLFNQGC